ncbi:helix-turn-helix transcriptional regulator [Olsenella uli]|uniref:helix-turn-helix domain-containing protein n=1 Tax=Olsenella uli TaxID=133926 RepID=UPI00195C53C8|nr:helix-turn-helix transcriptional regulator [Olsenella uli]MBM6676277.1 helix-turn-helix transcriptional regulator [Olsenella uli]
MSSATRQAFGKRVRQLRAERGLSLRKFALIIGTNKSYLVDVEYGRKSPTLDTIERIARGLDVTISFLVQGIDAAGGIEYDGGEPCVVVDGRGAYRPPERLDEEAR